jgi:hypothetical protein
VVADFVEAISGDSLMLMLILVAIMSLILGMGLPTTANYIVVSSLMAPVIVTLGAQEGLIVPLVAVHLFVFYFGILADDTPPVGLAAYAAAAISGGDPIRTGVQGFMYDIRTALLPFMFIFNTELLLIDVGLFRGIYVFIVACIGMLLFAAATQRYFLAPSRWWETVALLLVAFTLFRPGFWLDQVSPQFDSRPGAEVIEVAGERPADGELRIILEGTDFNDPDERTEMALVFTLGEPGSGAERIERAGLTMLEEEGRVVVEEPFPGTRYSALSQDFDFYAPEPVIVREVQVRNERMPKDLFFIPALLLLALIVLVQRRRMTKPAF